ncbi:MAG: hypothetical protein H2172_14125 [Opitutus sp.]|nr:hypothetical protein [Opitutus sp.]MCS6247344.1 hypothetical protein [Opitutus sp.]MCS6275292.1 hypothetical protein [Opitutus sp.]MCS6277584.1 hypothetical protein [Opitutus sp.]MCS6300702.1 hypothetical protein [Opitutus sp.]
MIGAVLRRRADRASARVRRQASGGSILKSLDRLRLDRAPAQPRRRRGHEIASYAVSPAKPGRPPRAQRIDHHEQPIP